MVENSRHEANTIGARPTAEDLPFRIEIIDSFGKVERVLGRASSMTLARAMFKAALEENPDRRITLARGESVIQNTNS
jgi:hypothetical protein